NQASGGYACGVSQEGLLTGFCVTKNGGKHNLINNVSLEKGTKLVAFEDVTSRAKEIASKFPYARLLGLDFCVTEGGGTKLIEVNCVNNEINFYQMCNGPLFGNFTEEVILFASENKTSYCFDFNL
ncbi:MAG: hexapeptide transferase, partial [Bacteroidetes bacterium HGW-Bacteroidetes-12]